MSTGSQLPLDQIIGPLYGSIYFSAIMPTASYGVTCTQTLFYYVHYQNDFLYMKTFVAVLWMLDTIHEALVVAGAWKYILSGLTDISLFMIQPLELTIILLILLALITQGFFVYRIYILSKNIVTPLVWVILAIIQLVTGCIWIKKSLDGRNTTHIVPTSSEQTVLTISLSVTAGVDIMIAMFLTYLLVRKRLATAFSSTSHILQRLTVFAVNTGIWPALFALLGIITLHVFPTYALYAVFGLPLPSVYCNTLLANLNVRAYVRGVALPHNADADLFASTTSASDSTKADEQDGEVKVASFPPQLAIWKTTEVMRFPDVNWSTTSQQI